MRRLLFIISALVLLASANAQSPSFYDFIVKDIDGKDYALAQLKGKKVMVVNVASKCGYTKQYEGLQALYEQYGGEDFVIIGFPANNFLKQEPGTDEEIKSFCTLNYGVTFPMMAKISVKGKDIHPLYNWLTDEELNGVSDKSVSWNFQKFLLSEDGQLELVLSSKTKPDDEQIIQWIAD